MPTQSKSATARITFNETHKITDSLVAKLKPKAKPYFIYDSELSGFWLRVPSDVSQSTYLVNTKPQGSRKDTRRSIGKVSLFKSKEARELAREWIQQIKKGKDPKAEVKRKKAKTMTLGKAFDEYIIEHSASGRLSPRSVQNYRESINGRLKSLINIQINSLTKDDISNWYKRNATKSAGMTDRAYRELSAVLNYQVVLERLDNNPASVVNYRKQRVTLKPKTSYLTTYECSLLLLEIPSLKTKHPHLVKHLNILLFTLLTGLRKSNVQSLKWSQIQPDCEGNELGLIVIEKTKNGDRYEMPLIPVMQSLLSEQKNHITSRKGLAKKDYGKIKDDCEYVFPNATCTGATNSPRVPLTAIFKKLGINKSYRDHDLRRTFASLADLAGISFTDIKHLMVHRKKDITELYMQSQEIKAKANYQQIFDLLASKVPYKQYIDQDSNDVTEYFDSERLHKTLFPS